MAIFNFGPWETKGLPVLDSSLPADVSVTATNSATFKVSIIKDGTPKEYAYQWYEDGKAISGANSATYTRNTTKNDGGTHLIYCTVTNKAGTVTSRTAKLTVNDSTFRAPKFTYSGSYTLTDDNGNAIQPGSLTENWIMVLLTGGSLNFSDLGNAAKGIDIFLCGGGGRGGIGYSWCGGGGGGGGYTNTGRVNVTEGTRYPVTIGGSGGATTAFGLTANPGQNGADSPSTSGVNDHIAGGAGTGYGGAGGNGSKSGGNGGDGVKAFGAGNIKFGAGGGGGTGAGGTSAGTGYGRGGATGGGDGAVDASWSGSNGQANTGGGGGGSGNNYHDYGGMGGSGIVIIRNKR